MDLVIVDERDMLEFLTLLVHNINTVDGIRDSATPYKQIIMDTRKYLDK